MTATATKAVSGEQLGSLLEDNMGLVVTLAKSFNPRDENELDEFVQIGRIAAWKAIQKHDPSRAALSTLIWHYVRWDILRHLDKNRAHFEHQLDESIPMEDNLVVSSDFWQLLPDCLTCNERKVVELRLDGHSFVDIGKEIGYSRGWANNTFKAALKKIRDANKETQDIDV